MAASANGVFRLHGPAMCLDACCTRNPASNLSKPTEGGCQSLAPQVRVHANCDDDMHLLHASDPEMRGTFSHASRPDWLPLDIGPWMQLMGYKLKGYEVLQGSG